MRFYHASTKKFSIGQVIRANAPTPYYVDAVSALENDRPFGLPSRSLCVFATDTPDFAVYFLLKQNIPLQDINLYLVEMSQYHLAPFPVVAAIDRRIRKGGDLGKLVSEFWNPSRTWRFTEAFSEEYKVLDIIDVQEPNVTIMFMDYQREYDLAEGM